MDVEALSGGVNAVRVQPGLHFALNTVNFVLKMMGFVLKMRGFVFKMVTHRVLRRVRGALCRMTQYTQWQADTTKLLSVIHLEIRLGRGIQMLTAPEELTWWEEDPCKIHDFNTQSIVFNTQVLVLNTDFIISTHVIDGSGSFCVTLTDRSLEGTVHVDIHKADLGVQATAKLYCKIQHFSIENPKITIENPKISIENQRFYRGSSGC